VEVNAPLYLAEVEMQGPPSATGTLREKYSEDQPRDEGGRWSETGVGGTVSIADIPGAQLVRSDEVEGLAESKQAGVSGWGRPDGSVVLFEGEHGQHVTVASEMGYGGLTTRAERTATIDGAYAAGNVRMRVIAETASHPEGRIYLDFRGERGRLAAVKILEGMQDSDKSVSADGEPGEVGFWRSTTGALRDLRANHWVVEDVMARKRALRYVNAEEVFAEKYSEDQLRDERGRWVGGAEAADPDSPYHRGVMTNVIEPERVEPTPDEAAGVDGKIHLKQCYDRAGRYILDRTGVFAPRGGPQITLVHGMIAVGGRELDVGGTGPFDDPSGRVRVGAVSIAHGWVELRRPDGREVVYDGVQGKFYDKASYYQTMRAVDEHRYTTDQATRMMLKTKNFGPWERTAGLTSGKVTFADGTRSRGAFDWDADRQDQLAGPGG